MNGNISIAPWVCPACRGSLDMDTEALRCSSCDVAYATIEGIPDFRLQGPAWIDFDEDRRMARDLVKAVPGDDVEAALRFVFARKNLE